jgi:hypothetical protein
MKTRPCPVTPDVCKPVTGWDAFLRHVYEHHTEGSTQAREMAVQRILAEGPGVREQMIVPKVTADTRTHILYAVLNGDLTRARELVGTLGPAERRAYLADLTRIINMLWGADL